MGSKGPNKVKQVQLGSNRVKRGQTKFNLGKVEPNRAKPGQTRTIFLCGVPPHQFLCLCHTWLYLGFKPMYKSSSQLVSPSVALLAELVMLLCRSHHFYRRFSMNYFISIQNVFSTPYPTVYILYKNLNFVSKVLIPAQLVH